MKYGARNKIVATVKKVKSGDVMSQVELDVTTPIVMTSVMTSDSLTDLALKPGDRVEVVVKAIHVLVVRES
jgi:molybdopterin-binding protein